MQKQAKISYWLIASAIISAILHNAIYGLFGVEESVFFILTLLLALTFAVSVVYSIITYIRNGTPKDLWKLGWLGLLGPIGLIPQFGSGFFGFFGFYAFFGLKRD